MVSLRSQTFFTPRLRRRVLNTRPILIREPASVKDNKEKDKIRAKPDKVKSKREAWKSLEPSPTKSKPSQNQESIKNVRLVELRTLRAIVVLKGISGTRSYVILIKCPTCLNDPFRIVLSVETRLMVIIVKDVLFSERSLRKTCLHIVLKMEFSKILPSHPRTIPTLLMLFESHSAHYGYNCPPKVPIVSDPEPLNNQTIKELPPTMQSFDPKSDLVHDSPNVFDPLPQLPFYSCEFCRNDARYGHYCTPQVPFIYPEPCYSQDFDFPHDFHDFSQQYLCCENYGVTHEAYQCQPMNEDYYHEQNSCYDSNSFGFNQFQPQQYTVNHPIFNVQNDIFDSQNKLMEQLTSMCEMVGQFIQKKEEEKQIEEEQAANARYWKIPTCYNDDDDNYTFAITPKEPGNSLIMGDEHLDTIPATESDEFIKSNVENLVSNPSESQGENECDSFSDEDFLKEIYWNPLFDEEIISINIDPHHFNAESDLIESLLNHDSSIISSSKIDSLFDEFAGELTLLKASPSGIDETDCDPEEETHFIQRLLYDNSSPHPPDSLMEEIYLSFTPDYPMPSGIEKDDYDSKRDILVVEELISNNSLSLFENESFHFDIPLFSRPPAKTTRCIPENVKTHTKGICPQSLHFLSFNRESCI
nr:hypothetical protein [Tanacetum cinerariifolium]